MASDDNTIVLGTRLESRETLQALDVLGEEVVSKIRDAAGTVEQEQFILNFDDARKSLRGIVEEFERTGKTSEEALGKAEAALRKVSGALSFEENLKLVPPEFEDISRASKSAGEAMEHFQKQAESGGKGAQRSAAQAQLAIDKLETAIEAARRTGGPVSTEWERRLVSLREEMRRGVETAGRFAAAQKDVQDELAASTEKAASFDEQATNLTDAIIKRFPKAQAAVIGFGASLATLQTAYSETRQFVDFMRERFGVDIDKAVQESIQGWALLIDEVVHGEERAQQAAERTANAAKIAAALGLERGKAGAAAVEDAQALLAQFEAIQQQIYQINQSGTQGLRDLAEGLAGIKTEDLEERLNRTLDVVSLFNGNMAELAASPSFPAFAEEVRKLAEILDKHGEALRANLSGQELIDFEAAVDTFQGSVRAKLAATVAFAVEATKDLLEAFGVQTPEAIRKSTDSLRGLIEVYGGLGKVTQEQAVQVAAEADRILKAIALLPPGQRAALADITASLHATSDVYRQHAEDVAAFAASGTKAIEEATEDRLAAWRKEREALRDLSAEAGSARDALLSTLKTKDSGRPGGGPDERAELRDLKAKPFQSEEDIARIAELEEGLLGVGRATGQLQEKQREGAASSEAVAAAIAKFREELVSTGGALNDLDKGAISVFLGRLQQTADEGNATAAVIQDAFGAVERTVADAQQRAAELNTAAAAGVQVAQAAASQAKALGDGTQNIVASVDAAGEILISNLDDVRKGSEVVKATLDDAATSGAEWSKATEKSGAAVDALVLGVDGLTAGMERVSVESARAGDGLQGIQDKGEGAGEALKLLSTHAGDAAEPVARVAKGLQAAAASVEPLHSSAEAVRSMAEDAPGLARDLAQLQTAAEIEKRAAALGLMATNLLSCALAAERLAKALNPTQIKAEADALDALADSLGRVAQGLEAERAAREGEGAPN